MLFLFDSRSCKERSIISLFHTYIHGSKHYVQCDRFPVDNPGMKGHHRNNRRGRRVALLFILFFLAVAGVSADTVFIALHLPVDEEDESLIPDEVTSAFEDGIMEPFFDAWHIVCNSRDAGTTVMGTPELKANGIDYYISVDLFYTPPGDGLGILETKYTLKSVLSGSTLFSGSCSSEDYGVPDETSGMDVYTLQGRAAAAEALASMSASM